MSECTSLASRPNAAPRRPVAGAVLDGVRDAWSALRLYWRMRATISRLEALDDRALRDIGLERDRIADAARDVVRRAPDF